MKTKKYFTFLLFPFMAFILSFCTSKVADEAVKGHTVHMNIEGIKFDSIQANLAIAGKRVSYPLKTEDHINWSFQIPDSIFEDFYLLTFKGFDHNQEIPHLFVFKADTLHALTLFTAILTGNENKIHFNILYIDKNDISELGSVYNFHIKKEGTDPEIPLSLYLINKYFEWGDGSLPYEEVVDNYQKLVMEYPDSYALAKVVTWISDWLKTGDLDKIYNLFSDGIKATDQGLYLNDYIERKKNFAKFDNIQLPDWKTEKPEYIIQDTAKRCLVVFSASWCGPCREEIPLLKEIYNQYKSKLDIVYISTDKAETMDDWKKLMENEKIPWRSVLSGYENGKISKKYFVSLIPTAYLVNLDGSFELFDVRDKTNQEKLKNMLKK